MDFLKKQSGKINNAIKSIFEKHENYLDILITEVNGFKNYLKKIYLLMLIYLMNGLMMQNQGIKKNILNWVCYLKTLEICYLLLNWTLIFLLMKNLFYGR